MAAGMLWMITDTFVKKMEYETGDFSKMVINSEWLLFCKQNGLNYEAVVLTQVVTSWDVTLSYNCVIQTFSGLIWHIFVE